MIQVQQDHCHRQAAKQAEARQAERTSPSGLAASPSAAAQGRRLAASPSAAAQGRRRGERSQCGVSRALLQRSAAEALLTAYMASGLAGSALSARGRAAVSSQPRAGARAASTRLSPLARRRASFVDAPQAKPPSHSLHDGVFSRSQLRPSRASRSERTRSAGRLVHLPSTRSARGSSAKVGPCWLVAGAKRALEAERAFLVDAYGVARVLGVEVEGVDSAMTL